MAPVCIVVRAVKVIEHSVCDGMRPVSSTKSEHLSEKTKSVSRVTNRSNKPSDITGIGNDNSVSGNTYKSHGAAGRVQQEESISIGR